MKKVLCIMMIAPALIFFLGCDNSSDKKDDGTLTEDEQLITIRISALESAINSFSFENYMMCFADGASYQDSYTEDQFNTRYKDTTYSFSDLAFDGDTATCTSTVMDDTGIPATHENTFTMEESDGDWYILLWTEDGTTIFQSPKLNK